MHRIAPKLVSLAHGHFRNPLDPTSGIQDLPLVHVASLHPRVYIGI